MRRIKTILLATYLIIANGLSAQNTVYVKFGIRNAPSNVINKLNKQFQQEKSLNEISYQPLLKEDTYRYLRDDVGLNRIFKFSFKNDTEKGVFLQKIRANFSIEYIQEPENYKIDGAPNDSLISNQWSLNKIGALKTFELIDELSTQLNDILVAVIDTGIDDKHPDLIDNIYMNNGEIGIDINGNDKRFNGIDDDNNGFIDDFKGFDFVDKSLNIENPSEDDYKDWDNLPEDENGHGTNIAGIIAATTNNKIGIAGIAPNVKILNLRAFDATGHGEDDDVASAIVYAVQAGAKVINMSFGDDKFSYLLKDAVKFAYDNGVVLVGSSGNSSSNLPHYPSSFSEVISVGASDENDFVASFSNYGSTLDLVAPGVDILTTAKGGEYGSVNGTSAAAPFVSAASAVILGFKNFEIEEVKQMLKTSTVDINAPGWDLNSGAGRLDIFKIVTSLSPGLIKINFPTQNYATSEDSLAINISVISPYFSSFQLQYGTGFNPVNWINIPVDGNKQIYRKKLPALDIYGFPDTVYTLRLIAKLTNDNDQEERINFYVDRSPPEAFLVNGGEAYIGNDLTILGSVYVEEPSTVKMYYKTQQSSEYDFVYMDQFNVNTKTVNYTHFGYVPVNNIITNATYDVYFEAVNLAGLSTVIDNNGKPFQFKINDTWDISKYEKLQFKLPAGRLYDAPVMLDNSQSKYLFVNPLSDSKTMQIYRYENDKFFKVDSIEKRIPKVVGDFNGNGKTDILSLFLRNGYIDEQVDGNSTPFITKFADTTGNFWPADARDFDGDGRTEILAFADSTFSIYEIQNDLSLLLERAFELPNASKNGYVGAPNIAACDLNNNGKNEIWFLTSNGSLHGYKINGPDNYEFYTTVNLGLNGAKNVIDCGDYDGDGVDDIAVLLKSNTNNDIAPFYFLAVFNLKDEEFNLISTISFIDAGSEISSGFTRKKYSLSFRDLDNDSKDELLINTYPFLYVFSREHNEDKLIFYAENVNSTNIFTGDLNMNGAYEIGVTRLENIAFFEIPFDNSPKIPKITDYYSIDSNKIYISWEGNSSNYLIYKGLTDSALSVLDTLNQNFIIDSAEAGKIYYYRIQSLDNGITSGLSDLITIYSHAPATIREVKVETGNSIKIMFTGKMGSEISNPKSFLVDGSEIPNSISPLSQYGYLLNFTQSFDEGEHALVVDELRDFYNSPVQPDTVTFTVHNISTSPLFFVESFDLVNSKTLKLSFNLPVDSKTAGNIQNYTFSPENPIKSVLVGKSNSVTLKTKYPLKSIGKEYSLKIEGVYSSDGSGKIKISDGAGSIVVLSSFENNLTEIYTYPNPVSISKTDKMTFAKLTKYAEILIFTIDGKKIIELQENDGNGGVDWNLKDENGSTINTGIYIYYVKALDEEGNVSETKLGKFVVVR